MIKKINLYSFKIISRKSKFLILLALLIFAAANEGLGQEFNADVWLEDFAQLKRELSGHYSNLDWAVEDRGLDLKQLSERTESRLRAAHSEAEAQRIIESFLAAFGDGHLDIQWIRKNDKISISLNESQSEKQTPLCERLGYEIQNIAPKLTFSKLENFREIKSDDSKYFPIGLLSFPDGKKSGLIQIPIFSPYNFPDLCEQATAELKLEKDSVCDDDCDDLVERESANLLTDALIRQIETLKREKINTLVVDITGNGGGTNWVEPADRIFSAIPLRSPQQQFIRHEHWTIQLKARLKVVEDDALALSVSNRTLLLKSANILRQAILESQQSCVRDAVWENQKPTCSIVATVPMLYSQSILAYAKPGSLPNAPSSRFLFYSSSYKYREGVFTGKLIVLIDQGTYSAAEYFAAMLQDNKAATIIGEPSGGAGCGYTNGGIPTYLKNSGARVKIPDCVRLRADGSNEVAGITPDVLIPWRRNDSPAQRVKRMDEILSKYLTGHQNRMSR